MTHSFTLAVAQYFKARPNQWVSSEALMQVGGRLAWRTRVSDARKLGLQIENRTRKVGRITISEYRYTVPVGQQQFSL